MMWDSSVLSQISLFAVSCLNTTNKRTSSAIHSLESVVPRSNNSAYSLLSQSTSTPSLIESKHDLEIPSSRYEWDHPITCSNHTDNNFCVYSSNSFHHNRGLSIITKPAISVEIAALPEVSLSQPTPLETQSSPPFEIKEISGRGMGVVANRTIERGEQIFAHPIIGIYHNDAFHDPKRPGYEERITLFRKSIEQLPENSKELFWKLAAHDEKIDGVIGRLLKNTFAANFGGEAQYYCSGDSSMYLPLN